MNSPRCCPLCLLLLFCLWGTAQAAPDREVLFQVSTFDALMNGLYDGTMTFKELRKHGDFGIGTFDGLDGEMIGLDGQFYQITADGAVHPVKEVWKTPFAAVTYFDTDRKAAIDQEWTYPELLKYLDNLLASPNIFYAIRIEGDFRYIKTRSVPRQNRPYPKLTRVVAGQPTFEMHETKGSLVGFRCPYYVKGVNVPGYHFHFINSARTKGGHVLELRLGRVSVAIDATREFRLSLPLNPVFDSTDYEHLGEQKASDVE